MKLTTEILNPFTRYLPTENQQVDRAAPATIPGYADNYNNSTAYSPFYLYNGALYGNQSAAMTVTQEGLLGLPAAWACVNLIAHSCATMMHCADVFDAAGNEINPTPEIIASPNAMYNSGYEFYYEIISTLLIHGNFIGVLYDGQIVPVHPSYVYCRIGNDGFPVYRIGEYMYGPQDILHIRGFTMPGTWWGQGVIQAQRAALAASVNMQGFASTTYSSGAVPTAVIKLDAKNVPAETLHQVGNDWQNSFGYGNRKPVVLPQGIDVQPLAWSPEDSQFLQSRQFNIAEIALMFGLSPVDLTSTIGGQNLTYANVSEVNLERVKRSFAPWVMRVEQAFQKLLPLGYKLVADPEALLRMDTKSRYESYQVALAGGWLTVEEVRQMENLPPLGTPLQPEEEPVDL